MVALLDALAGAFCHRFACISFHLPPTYLLCWMPWPDHVATGLFSFLFIRPAHDCFAGCLGRIILPKVSFHVCSCASHLVHCWTAWPDRCAKVFLHFFLFVSHMVALLDALSGPFCHRFAFISLPDGSAGAFCQRFLLYVFMCLADDCFAGCLGRIILQEFAFISFHMSSTVLMCWMPWPDHFAKGFLSILYHLSPTWLLCWMPWPGRFATGLLAFLFICLPHTCFAGCLGRIMLPQVCFHFFSFVLHMIALLDALAGSFCQRFPFMSVHVSLTLCIAGCLGWSILPKVCFHCFSLVSQMIAVLEAWLDHFARDLLSFLFICLANDCFAECLGRIILPRFSFTSFYLSPTWLLCWMPCPDHFATGLLSFLCRMGWPGHFARGFLLHVFICLPHGCFAGCLGRIILQEFAFISFHMSST